MITAYRLLLIIGLLFQIGVCVSSEAVVRERISFNKGWRFDLNDQTGAEHPDYNDSSWRLLNLPHDWSIEGDFSADNPSGTGGGALPGGTAWYRKTFQTEKRPDKCLYRIEFDGVYMNASVYINGYLLGTRPYGYVSYGYDITPYLKWGTDNVIAVRVDNQEQPNSRWYSGCGIYRNVWLVKTASVRVAPYGTYVTTPEVTPEKASVRIAATVLKNGKSSEKITLCNRIKDANGKDVACSAKPLPVRFVTDSVACVTEELTLANPEMWDVASPSLYTVTTLIYAGGKLIDSYETVTGIRTFLFSAEKGFVLNGKPLKINGVCMHHDLGCLGAAVNTVAIERQLRILREMGCNGIRCSHNPPAPELLDLCDRMGFIVMDEAFDMWRKKKTAHDYARYFDEWHERDLHDFIVRDRNHPSVFMWSIGNEVLEQWTDVRADTLSLEEANRVLNFGHAKEMLATGDSMSVNSLLTRKLADFVKTLDPTRPVTAGCNEPDPANHLFRSGALDIIGYNYHNKNIPQVPVNFPGRPFIIAESNSALMTRGYYRMPSDSVFLWPERWDKPFFDPSFACSSYDHCHAPWGSTHEETWKMIRKNDFISGQYVWTGFDYLGEPTPYGWPARSSYFGIVDLAGFPKDIYYMYQAEWTDKPVLHLFPHWNWTPGQLVDMWCYFNRADEAELYVNGVSQGICRKEGDELHVSWRVAFEPGSVTVVTRKDGVQVAEKTILTAGAPARIRLTPDKNKLRKEETDLSFVTVEVVDEAGNLCPFADNRIHFTVGGNPIEIAGVDNGSPISAERFKDNKRKAFYGKCLVVLQSNEVAGISLLTASADGLQPATVEIITE